jgi:hypothetical protein
MKVRDLAILINGELINESANLDRDVKGAFGADLMSDVLASIRPDAVLITGLCNPQVVRTAQMADIAAIVFVRGKMPPQETIDLASEEGIALIASPHGMYELCGRLYQSGLTSLE